MLVSVRIMFVLCVAWKFGRLKLWGKLDVLFLDIFGLSSQHSMSPFASTSSQKETSCLKSSRGYFYPANALAATGSWMPVMLASTLQMVHGGTKTKLISNVWNDSVLESVNVPMLTTEGTYEVRWQYEILHKMILNHTVVQMHWASLEHFSTAAHWAQDQDALTLNVVMWLEQEVLYWTISLSVMMYISLQGHLKEGFEYLIDHRCEIHPCWVKKIKLCANIYILQWTEQSQS